ncbi:MAG TPA: hypothetical protein VF192_17645 [Longimicrobiales bacterium]
MGTGTISEHQQRQEGLRQAILEAVDESHPGAFRRMIRLIREQNLARFSSVVRAFDTWFGFMWDGSSGIRVDEVLGTVERFFDDTGARDAALAGRDPEPAYLALWTIAFDDVDAAIPPAIEPLRADTAELRFVATHFLVQALWTTAIPPLVDMLADPDLRVAARALDAFRSDVTRWVPAERLFDRLEALHARIAKRAMTLDAIVWPWWRIRLDRQTVASAMAANGRTALSRRLLPYVRDLDPSQRAATLRYLAGLPELSGRWEFDTAAEPRKREPLSAEIRGLVLEMLGDASAEVRKVAFEALAGSPVEDDEVDRLIALLGRRAGDLRSACLARLQTLDDDRLEASIERLLADTDAQRRTAGLELLRYASAAGRFGDRARAIAERYRAAHADAGETERAHVEAVLGSTDRPPTLDDALGLVAPGTLRTWPDPRERDLALETPAARASLISLARLVLEHQTTDRPPWPCARGRVLRGAGRFDAWRGRVTARVALMRMRARRNEREATLGEARAPSAPRGAAPLDRIVLEHAAAEARAAPRPAGRHAPRRRAARAATLVLLAAGGVAAAVPGSPVREWISRVWPPGRTPGAGASAGTLRVLAPVSSRRDAEIVLPVRR